MQAPVQLFLVRHGEVEERYHFSFGGCIDMPLSPRGHDQAACLARYLVGHKLDAIYVSPMQRVQQTLGPLHTATALPPIVLPDLREVDFGDWTGLDRDAVRERYGASASDWLAWLDADRMPNAEPATAFRARVERSLQHIVGRHAGQKVAVLCHGGVIRMMLSILLALPLPTLAPFEIEYASLTRVDVAPHKTRLKLLNFTPWRDQS